MEFPQYLSSEMKKKIELHASHIKKYATSEETIEKFLKAFCISSEDVEQKVSLLEKVTEILSRLEAIPCYVSSRSVVRDMEWRDANYATSQSGSKRISKILFSSNNIYSILEKLTKLEIIVTKKVKYILEYETELTNHANFSKRKSLLDGLHCPNDSSQGKVEEVEKEKPDCILSKKKKTELRKIVSSSKGLDEKVDLLKNFPASKEEMMNDPSNLSSRGKGRRKNYVKDFLHLEKEIGRFTTKPIRFTSITSLEEMEEVLWVLWDFEEDNSAFVHSEKGKEKISKVLCSSREVVEMLEMLRNMAASRGTLKALEKRKAIW